MKGIAGGAVLLATLLLASHASAQDTAPPAPPAEAAPAPAPVEPHHTALPYILMGTGIVLLTSAVVLEVSSVHQNNQVDDDDETLAQLPNDDPRKPAVQSDRDDHHDKATTERTVAIALGVAGALSVGGSVILWFVEAGQPAPSAAGSAKALPPSKPKMQFLPSLGPSFAGAALSGSF